MTNYDIVNELNLLDANGFNGLYRSFSARNEKNLTIINYYFTKVFPVNPSLFVNPIQTAKNVGYFFNPFEGFITYFDFQEVEKYLDIIFNKFDVDYFVSKEMVKIDEATYRGDDMDLARYLPQNLAAYTGKLEFFKFFIDKGFDINSNYEGMASTSFYDATRGGAYEIMEYIIAHPEFDLKKPSRDEMTPLMSLLKLDSTEQDLSYIDGLLRNLILKIDDENYLTKRFDFINDGNDLNLMEFAFSESDYKIFKLFTNILKEKNIILGISTLEEADCDYGRNELKEVIKALYCKLNGINIDFSAKIKSKELHEDVEEIYVKADNIFKAINQALECDDNINLSSLQEHEKIFPTKIYDKLQENFLEKGVFKRYYNPSTVQDFIIKVIDIYKEVVLEEHSDAIIRLIEANKDNHHAHEQLHELLSEIIGFKANNFGEVIEIVYDKLGYNNLKLINQTLICFFEDIALDLDAFQAMEAELGPTEQDELEEESNVVKSKIEKFASFKPYGYLSYIQSEKEFNDYSKINYILALNQAEVGNNILTHIQAIQTQDVNNDLKKFIKKLVYNYDNSMTDGDKEACLSHFHESAINDADNNANNDANNDDVSGEQDYNNLKRKAAEFEDDSISAEQDNIKWAKLEVAEHNDGGSEQDYNNLKRKAAEFEDDPILAEQDNIKWAKLKAAEHNDGGSEQNYNNLKRKASEFEDDPILAKQDNIKWAKLEVAEHNDDIFDTNQFLNNDYELTGEL